MSDKYVKTGREWHKTDGSIYDSNKQFPLYNANCGRKVMCTNADQEPVNAKTDSDPTCNQCANGHVIPASMLPKY